MSATMRYYRVGPPNCQLSIRWRDSRSGMAQDAYVGVRLIPSLAVKARGREMHGVISEVGLQVPAVGHVGCGLHGGTLVTMERSALAHCFLKCFMYSILLREHKKKGC